MNAWRHVYVLLVLPLLWPQPARLQQIDWEAEAARLEMYRQHWNTHDIGRYEFLFEAECFCTLNGFAWVVVEDGDIAPVTHSHLGISVGAVTIDGADGPVVVDPSSDYRRAAERRIDMAAMMREANQR